MLDKETIQKNGTPKECFDPFTDPIPLFRKWCYFLSNKWSWFLFHFFPKQYEKRLDKRSKKKWN